MKGNDMIGSSLVLSPSLVKDNPIKIKSWSDGYSLKGKNSDGCQNQRLIKKRSLKGNFQTKTKWGLVMGN